MAGNELFNALRLWSGVMALEFVCGGARLDVGDMGGGEDHENVAAGEAF